MHSVKRDDQTGNLSNWLASEYPIDWQQLSRSFQRLPYGLPNAVGWGLPLDAVVRTLHNLKMKLPADMQRAVIQRQMSYIAGRLCAECALMELGLENSVVQRGEFGIPLWPNGVVGSITHTPQHAYALVAFPIARQAVGIDCEPIISLEQAIAVAEICCHVEERRRWFSQPIDPRRATLFFSAKEAAYKAIARQVGRIVDFTEFEVIAMDELQSWLLLQACVPNVWPIELQQIKVRFQLGWETGNLAVIHTFVEY